MLSLPAARSALMALMLASSLIALPVAAQVPGPAVPAASAVEPVMADGEVRRIDKSTDRITLRHGEIRNLDMPPMTMVFMVKDKSLLDRVKVGDKVRFSAIEVGGKYVVTDIQPAP